MRTALVFFVELLVLRLSHLTSNFYYISDINICFCIFFTSLALLFDLRKSKVLHNVKGFIVLGYILRLFVMFMDLYTDVPILGSGADTERFFREMTYIVMNEGYQSRHLYARIIGKIFCFTGISRLLGQYINVLISVLTIYFVVCTLECLEVNTTIRRRTVLLMSVLPITLCMSAVLLRESFITMLISLAVYLCMKWIKNGRVMYIILSITASLAATAFHSGSIGITVGIAFIIILYDRRQGILRLKPSSVILGFLFVIIFAFALTRYQNTLFRKFVGIDSIDDIAAMDSGSSSYARYVGDSGSPLRMALFSIPRMFFFLFSPVPWMWRGGADLVAFFFSSFIYLVVIIKILRYTLVGNKQDPYNKYILSLILITGITVFIFSWGTINAGTALRHREKMIPCFMILYALTKSWRRNNNACDGIN